MFMFGELYKEDIDYWVIDCGVGDQNHFMSHGFPRPIDSRLGCFCSYSQ